MNSVFSAPKVPWRQSECSRICTIPLRSHRRLIVEPPARPILVNNCRKEMEEGAEKQAKPRKSGGGKGKTRGISSSTSTSTTPPSIARTATRQTRSQAAPEWTVEEILVLISEIAALDEDWLKAFSSYQKWKMIADSCIVREVVRPSNQCKRKWEQLLVDYTKIRNWESDSALSKGTYWSLSGAKRKAYRLPAEFDDQVFGSMDAVIRAQEAEIGSESEELTGGVGEDDDDDDDDSIEFGEEVREDDDEGSDSDFQAAVPQGQEQEQVEEVVGLLDAELADADTDTDADPPIDLGTAKSGAKIGKNTSQAREMTNKLKENAEKIQSILRGELPDTVSQRRALVDLTKPFAIESEIARRQADELIKVFGVLVTNLDQFSELIKESGCDGISLNPKSS